MSLPIETKPQDEERVSLSSSPSLKKMSKSREKETDNF